MGNYVQGTLTFILNSDAPSDLIRDLKYLSDRSDNFNWDSLTFLKDTKWFENPNGYLANVDIVDECEIDGNLRYYIVINICMKMRYYVPDLGQRIYETLFPYLDKNAYDTQTGGFIGKLYDEDGKYDNEFYVDVNKFKQIQSNRSFICNNGCKYYNPSCMCSDFDKCSRAYRLGSEEKTI